jgi:cytoskeletal protein CcmA (bactofilin family)
MKYVNPFGDREHNAAEAATPDSHLVAGSISPQPVSGVKELPRPAEPGLVVSLHKGSQITGQLMFQGPAMIDGNVEGEIHCHGKLIIGAKADVRAKISGQIITIQGRVEGNVTAEEIELAAPAQLCGNITTRRLIINEGAVFDGDCSMGVARQNSEVASRQKASADRVEAAQSPKLHSDSGK